jgi:sodium/potassium-transporting ATPase subunit alpha
VPFVAFALFKFPLALTIFQVLAIDLGTNLAPALGLGAEPLHPEVMHRPPRARTEQPPF